MSAPLRTEPADDAGVAGEGSVEKRQALDGAVPRGEPRNADIDAVQRE
jgi:hypothetical protein